MNWMATSVVAVYIIHDNEIMRPVIWEYVWPNMNAIGDTRTTEDIWLKSMTAYGSYSRYATNNSLTVMSENDFWQSIVDGAMVKFIDNSSSS